jgi:hypothetical protein
MRGQRPLGVDRGCRGLLRCPKDGEERVALGVDLATVMLFESSPQDARVLSKDFPVATAMLAQKTRRALDVREKERDSAAR